MSSSGPLLVFGPWSMRYDFGPDHPLTPLRFGPGIDLLRAVGAEPGLEPEPIADDELLAIHEATYLAAIRRFSADPDAPPALGVARGGDVPPFAGMHDASAAVAGGSLRAVEAILRGEVEHAQHPGGGLHHAMAARASGFCVYNDVALAIAAARRAGRRVLYVDLDVHHGDGVEAIHRADPGVLTISIHESGRYLFPGTGFVNEIGQGVGAGTVVNVPLEPLAGDTAWLAAVREIVPSLAAAFGPDIVVSQHGADSHAWDPLAHLRVTTTAMGEAARLVDAVAHRHGGGRWLATGGGGYEIYRVVPRAWALTWLAGAHREPPGAIPAGWLERWATDADRQAGGRLPERFEDPPNAGLSRGPGQDEAERRAADTVGLARRLVLPRLLAEAEARGWWAPLGPPGAPAPAGDPGVGRPAVIPRLDAATLERLAIAARVVAPVASAEARALLLAALRSDDRVCLSAAVDGTSIIGLAVSAGSRHEPGTRSLLALGVAPDRRRAGLGRRLLEEHLASFRPGDGRWEAFVAAGERDPVEPLPLADRMAIAERLLAGAGFVRPRPTGGEAPGSPETFVRA